MPSYPLLVLAPTDSCIRHPVTALLEPSLPPNINLSTGYPFYAQAKGSSQLVSIDASSIIIPSSPLCQNLSDVKRIRLAIGSLAWPWPSQGYPNTLSYPPPLSFRGKYKGQGHDHGMPASLTLTPSISLIWGAVGCVAEINHPEQC